MDSKELRQKTAEELRLLADELRSDIQNARFKVATRQTKNVKDLKRLKRDLSRVLTISKQI